MVAVGRGVRASVASGENLTGLEQFRPLLTAGAVDIVQTASVWGVTHFLRVAALAHAHDLPVSPVGTTPMSLLHAATAVPNHLASELQDLTPPVGLTLDLTVQDGLFVLGDSPGLGITVDESTVAAVTRPTTGGRASGTQVRPEHAGRRLTHGAPR
jgi:L-alanine-DL-glutamate epimerase-like enolase superfamily enzyme